MKQNAAYVILTMACLVLLLLSCSSSGSYKIQSFFFDGVPDPTVELYLDAQDSILILDSGDSIVRLTKPKTIYHPPYLEKKCNQCHSSSIGSMKYPKEELCFTCHNTITNNYIEQHGPFASGNCTQCHNPHQSKHESLLLNNDNSLCFTCHNEEKIAVSKIHSKVPENECVNCHNPHGGAQQFYLEASACLECHDVIKENATMIHGPIGAGMCNQCHENHRSSKPKLLKNQGVNLCFNCHIEQDIYKNSIHIENKIRDCISCHDPHSSQQVYLIKNDLR